MTNERSGCFTKSEWNMKETRSEPYSVKRFCKIQENTFYRRSSVLDSSLTRKTTIPK